MRRITEERTRKELIDPQLERADWYLRDHSKMKIEMLGGGMASTRFAFCAQCKVNSAIGFRYGPMS